MVRGTGAVIAAWTAGKPLPLCRPPSEGQNTALWAAVNSDWSAFNAQVRPSPKTWDETGCCLSPWAGFPTVCFLCLALGSQPAAPSLPLTSSCWSGRKGQGSVGQQVISARGCRWQRAPCRCGWNAGYLRRRRETTAPLALKGCFIPEGSLVWRPLLWLPLLPPEREYSSVSLARAPRPQLGHRGRVCDCLRDSEQAGAGWGA